MVSHRVCGRRSRRCLGNAQVLRLRAEAARRRVARGRAVGHRERGDAAQPHHRQPAAPGAAGARRRARTRSRCSSNGEIAAHRRRLQEAAPGPRGASPAATRQTPVLAEAGYVEQILVNLFSNAAKYSPAGEAIDIAVRREHGLRDGQRLRPRHRHLAGGRGRRLHAVLSERADVPGRCRGWASGWRCANGSLKCKGGRSG